MFALDVQAKMASIAERRVRQPVAADFRRRRPPCIVRATYVLPLQFAVLMALATAVREVRTAATTALAVVKTGTCAEAYSASTSAARFELCFVLLGPAGVL